MDGKTSLDRVLAAVGHEQVDKIPLDLGSSYTTGITAGVYRRLREALDLGPGSGKLVDVVQQLAYVETDVVERLGVDVRGVFPNIVRKNPMVSVVNGVEQFTDEWGVGWERPPGALYFHAVGAPLANVGSVAEVEDYAWPDTGAEALFDGLAEEARGYTEHGYAVMLECVSAGMFEMCCRLRGTEQFYMDLLVDPDLACELMDQLVALKVRFYKAAAERLGDWVHCIRESDDVAGQEALLISPDTYRDLIKPRHQQLFEAQRRLFPNPFFVWFHSDGALFDLLPDFVEIGVEVLNPLQLEARGMDGEKVKAAFGADLAFWGAGVHTQGILPGGTVEEVCADVEARVGGLREGSGFVFGSVHNIQDDVPTENLLAMLETFDRLR